VADSLNAASPEFSRIEQPLTIAAFGGWERAYPDIIEGVWRRHVSHRVAGH
jgi:hypothetical protein